MASLNIFPDKHVMSVFVLLYFVLIFCRHVSCVNVTRNIRDVFSYTGIFNKCSGFCQRKRSYLFTESPGIGKCSCQCDSNYRTFVTADLRCVKDKEIRNTGATSLKFKLYEYERPDGHLNVTLFQKHTTILFLPPKYYNEICDLNDIEELDEENLRQWNSVKDEMSNYSIIEIDDDDIERRFTWLDMKYEGWMMLRLELGVSPDRFVGRIMRINVTCENSRRGSPKDMTGVMVFKVNGTFKVPDDITTSSTSAPVMSSSYYLTPTPSTSSLFMSSTTSTVMTSSPLLNVTSSSLQLVTSSSLQPITSSSLQPITSSSLQPITSSSLQPTISSFPTMMSSSTQPIKPSSTQEALTSSTIPFSKSSLNVLTESVASSSTLSSMAFGSSSMIMIGPAHTSKSSSNGAVTGAIVAGLMVLLVIVVFVVYVFRKKRLIIIRQKPFKKRKDLGHANPNYPNLQIIPALNNPLNDGIYENPEVFDRDTNRRSRITAIDSAAYDSCIIVENPSAEGKVKSVYDNIPDPAESTYKALDPTKREPSAKYQSLIKNVNGSGLSNQEPLYSEVDRLSPVPMRNGHGARGPTPPPFTSRKSFTPAVVEPIYNELENSGGERENENFAPTLPPRQPHTPAVAEPIYNELENSSSQTEEKVDGSV